MVTVPLGLSAYKRTYDGAPEIKLVNRFVEKSPSNLKEKVALLARPGTNSIANPAGGSVRSSYAKNGLFSSDLFLVAGTSFYRLSTTGVLTQITGTIANNGFTYAAWMKGIGYEFLFISDGATLQYYTTHAMGTLTLTRVAQTGVIQNQLIIINGVYYGWNATVDTGAPAGTALNPYYALLDASGDDEQSIANMVLAINGSGIPGHDYSSNLVAPNASVTAVSPTAATLALTAIVDGVTGNAITTTVAGGNLAWGAATLTGGGGTTLQTVAMPNANEVPKAVAAVASYVLVSVGGSQKFYWLNPGEVVIDPLNFASKESNPDPIVDMKTVGDTVYITGQGSTEVWYATGDLAAPFAPIEGRVFKRGVIDGTPVAVKDAVILVGEDGVVYQIGTSGAETAWGVAKISDPGIEERIRTQLRRVQGLAP